MGHFGGDAQAYSKEALDWLTAKILNQEVRCQVLRRDQYNRIVSSFLIVAI
jgi:endonuclease YncB( thermonuclease family)